MRRIPLPRALAVAALAAGAAAGCHRPPIKTDSPAYILHASPGGFVGSIPLVFTNPRKTPIYYPKYCGYRHAAFSLQKLVNEEWIEAWESRVPACATREEIAAQAEHRDTFMIYGAYPENSATPRFTAASISGTYRVVWHNLTTGARGEGLKDTLLLEERISNPFALTVEQSMDSALTPR